MDQGNSPLEFFTEYIDLLSSSVISCNPQNCEMKVFDPWRNGESVTRGQIAEESLVIYEKLFTKLEVASLKYGGII